MPSAFVWRGRRYEVRDVIGRWRIEGRWWEDGREREYWRGGGRGGGVGVPFEDRRGGRGALAPGGPVARGGSAPDAVPALGQLGLGPRRVRPPRRPVSVEWGRAALQVL